MKKFFCSRMRAFSNAHQQGWQRVQGRAHFRGRFRHVGFGQVAARDHSGRRWGAFRTLLFALAPDSRYQMELIRFYEQNTRPDAAEPFPSHVIFIPDTQTLHARARRKVAASSRFHPRAKPTDLKNPAFTTRGLTWMGLFRTGSQGSRTPRRRTHMFIHSTGSKRG